MAKVFTIGHSNRKWSEFVSTLKDNHIDVVVDVSRYTGSRKCPQFNKEQMVKTLKTEDVSYGHIEKLGGRRKQSDITRSRYDNNNNNSRWKNEGFRAYADYMARSFKEAIHEIPSLMTNYNNLTIMCAEARKIEGCRIACSNYIALAPLPFVKSRIFAIDLASTWSQWSLSL
jgi:uncharacterized protein (DUF488 family)